MAEKIGILSLGCCRNLVDSEHFLGALKAKGHSVVDIKDADVGIVNTCAFIEDAKTESIDAILDMVELKRQGRLKKIIVCGCLSQRYKDSLRKELPEIDALIGRFSLAESTARFAISPKHYAYLKICESCFNKCSFCIIPEIKGKFASLSMKVVLSQAKALQQSGVRELNVVGQDTSAYGLDLYGRRALPELIGKVLESSKRIKWLRVLYLYPDFKTIDALLDLMSRHEKLCKYIDLPLQHVNDRILKSMNRHASKKDIFKIIERIRKKVPRAAIRTSFITGFPGETDKEFRECLDFIKDVKFERLGAFIYSPEEGTAARDFKGQVPEAVKKKRLEAIMQTQQEISRQVNARMLGSCVNVLIDEADNGNYSGRSEYDAPEVDGLVYVRSRKKLRPGDFIKVNITDTLEYDLVGEAA